MYRVWGKWYMWTKWDIQSLRLKLSMCMPVLMLTLAVDGGEWSASVHPPARMCTWRLCVPHSALEKGTLTCPYLKTVEVRNPQEGLIAWQWGGGCKQSNQIKCIRNQWLSNGKKCHIQGRWVDSFIHWACQLMPRMHLSLGLIVQPLRTYSVQIQQACALYVKAEVLYWGHAYFFWCDN
jgi:hypothetical protein